MNNLKTFFGSIGTGVSSFFSWFIGGLDGFLITLATFVVIGFFSCLLKSCMEKNLSRKELFRLIIKKAYIFIIVGVSHILDYYIIQGGNYRQPLLTPKFLRRFSGSGSARYRKIPALEERFCGSKTNERFKTEQIGVKFQYLEVAYIRSAVTLFFISNESISILENASCFGLPVPERLREIIGQLKK